MPNPISVVICTCDRPDMIGAAVESVLAQDHPQLEVLVIDQSRSGETGDIVGALAAADDRVRYVRLEERGLSRAYNRGLRDCRHETVAFTDDDCVAPPDWLARIEAAFAANPGVDLVYGQVLEPAGLEGGEEAASRIPTLPLLRSERITMREGFRVVGMGANFASTRSSMLRLGGFDEVLGGGGPLQSAQDFDYTYRLCRAGGTILLEPSVVVRHFGMRSPEQWPGTARSYGIGVGGFYFKHVRAGDLYAAWLLARVLATGYLRLAKRALLRQPNDVFGTFLASITVGIRSSLAFSVDRRRRLYAPSR